MRYKYIISVLKWIRLVLIKNLHYVLKANHTCNINILKLYNYR